MIKLPAKLKIGSHEYEVDFPHSFEGLDDTLGLVQLCVGRIFIADQQQGVKRSDSMILKTLIHEVIHAIDTLSGQNVFVNKKGWNEIAVDAWAEWLMMFLIDNPDFLKVFEGE